MFGFIKKTKSHELIAPQTGKLIPLSDVPDDAFAQKILGDGVAIIPLENEIYAPANGTIEQISATKHAIGIHTYDGLDVLIHIGINTVELNGEGFEVFVKEGDKVKTGDLIARADLELIRKQGYNTHTPIVITNLMDISINKISPRFGDSKSGETVILTYNKA